MTIGYYAIPPKRSKHGMPPTQPWPYCRACVKQLGGEKLAPIDENASPAIKCRGCRERLRSWR
jgi:hypothetical protein